MLTPGQIQEAARTNDQYSPPEDSFSPRWHTENPAQVDAERDVGTGKRLVRLNLQNVLCPDGHVRLRNIAAGQELNPGESFV